MIDGDTIEIAGERIRLYGIDAPETKQTCTNADGKEWRCGQDATFALAKMIGDQWITCKGKNRDRYGRLIAVCYTGLYDLNAKMVRQGWAMAYRRYSTDYVQDELAAKAVRKRGMWHAYKINVEDADKAAACFNDALKITPWNGPALSGLA